MTSEDGIYDGVAFTVSQGRAAGLTDGRMRGSAYARPHHGVRVAVARDGRVRDIVERCEDLRVVLPPGARFSHATAARIWGMPLPHTLADALHVTTSGPGPIRRPGVVGWLRAGPVGAADGPDGLPVMPPADTWVQLATMSPRRGGCVDREELVAAGDFLISGSRVRRGRSVPLATPAELADAVARHGARRGAQKLAWALPRLRSPVDSPQETRLRLALVGAGLPEPEVQPALVTAAGPRHPDLAYLPRRLLLEYLGDVHRTDVRTWRSDLTRVQLFEDAGYRVILVGADDLHADALPALISRVRRALERTR